MPKRDFFEEELFATAGGSSRLELKAWFDDDLHGAVFRFVENVSEDVALPSHKQLQKDLQRDTFLVNGREIDGGVWKFHKINVLIRVRAVSIFLPT